MKLKPSALNTSKQVIYNCNRDVVKIESFSVNPFSYFVRKEKRPVVIMRKREGIAFHVFPRGCLLGKESVRFNTSSIKKTNQEGKTQKDEVMPQPAFLIKRTISNSNTDDREADDPRYPQATRDRDAIHY